MELSIISAAPASRGRRLQPYRLDEIDTVGALPNEPYSIRFRNTSGAKIQIAISVDGTNVLTGRKATLDSTHDTFVVAPYATSTLDAWPETTRGGARFLFGETEDSVAVHTHGDITAKGYVSVAVFTEGYRPPAHSIPRGGFDFGDEVFRGGGMRGGPVSYGGGTKGMTTRGGPATGAGEYVDQHIGTAQGLIRPEFSELVQVRYLWWDDVVNMLREQGFRPTPVHPSGFEPQRMADLGTTPRPGGNDTTTPVEYNRFAAA